MRGLNLNPPRSLAQILSELRKKQLKNPDQRPKAIILFADVPDEFIPQRTPLMEDAGG